jgi:hypothetical protein
MKFSRGMRRCKTLAIKNPMHPSYQQQSRCVAACACACAGRPRGLAGAEVFTPVTKFTIWTISTSAAGTFGHSEHLEHDRGQYIEYTDLWSLTRKGWLTGLAGWPDMFGRTTTGRLVCACSLPERGSN